MALKHANAGDIVDLSPLGSRLKDTKTAAIIKSEAFEAVRLVVRAGATIPTHHVPGPITLHGLEGRAVISVSGAEVELKSGDWLYLEGGEPHSVRGIEDSSILLTIIFAD
ncbi:cupin domain-containing protein [Aurantimonas sp. DM33-3]|uniref:cupin domain-containing protein n=1 Tax=Aurantimonas sp. DM33-3 TaxID=2766955 RepID=UPI0016522B04|nr:cupin domain-containing protein [Aurantimonas sp. DM33-3]MBC6718731.1 cupin domain-containing protein [Aurantimonas sp. DM33-3]